MGCWPWPYRLPRRTLFHERHAESFWANRKASPVCKQWRRQEGPGPFHEKAREPEQSKFEEAENCLTSLLEAHKNWSGLAEKVHAKLKEMYRATGQTEKFGDMLKTMVVAQSRMDFYKEYKDFVPKQQWNVALVEFDYQMGFLDECPCVRKHDGST